LWYGFPYVSAIFELLIEFHNMTYLNFASPFVHSFRCGSIPGWFSTPGCSILTPVFHNMATINGRGSKEPWPPSTGLMAFLISFIITLDLPMWRITYFMKCHFTKHLLPPSTLNNIWDHYTITTPHHFILLCGALHTHATMYKTLKGFSITRVLKMCLELHKKARLFN